jgi:DNA-binding CsgD family transcriptional regulator
VVFVTDPEARVEVPAEAVRRHLGLTKAEAELAVLLATGRSVEEAARDLGRAPETARTQMKRVLARTKVHRQADLVRLVLTSPATFGKPPGSV